FVVSAGAHRCWLAPHSVLPAAPCTISMQTRRVRSRAAALAVFVHNPRAGIMASRNGSATVAPRPRSMVRRGMCLPTMNDIVISEFRILNSEFLILRALHPERAALHNRKHE